MNVKLLAEHHLELLSLKGGRTGSSESTLVKMSHCWKSHVACRNYGSIDRFRPIFRALDPLDTLVWAFSSRL